MDKLLKFLNINKSSQSRQTTHPLLENLEHTAPDLQQGVEYLHDINNMCSSLYESVTLLEHFTNMKDNSNPLMAEQEQEMKELKELEEKFNKLLAEYAVVYKEYGTQLQRSLQSESNKYNNNTIMTPDGSGYYVNGFGISRWWSGDAWNNRSSTCPPITHVSTNDIESLGLTKGPNMGIGEPCGYEGSNVQLENISIGSTYLGCYADNGEVIGLEKGIGNKPLNECVDEATKQGYKYVGYHGSTCYASNSYPNDGEDESRCPSQSGHRVGSSIYNAIYEITDNATKKNNFGYVDENNKIRPYPSSKMINNTGTCPSGVRTIPSNEWNALTKGSSMTPTTLCNLGKVDLKDKRELEEINRELLNTANQMYEKIQVLQNKYKSYNELSNSQEEILQTQLNKYRHMYDKIKKISNNDNTLNAMMEDTNLTYKSSHLKFIVWSLLSGLLIMYAIKHIRK